MIRRVEPDDWKLLRDVRLRALREDPDAFLATHDQEAAFADEQWQARASQAHGASFVAEGEDGGEGLATGIIDADPAVVFLVGMWVAPARRGDGTARELVDARRRLGAVASGERSFASPSRETNDRAARLYERCGFTETKDPPELPYTPNDGNRFFVFEL